MSINLMAILIRHVDQCILFKKYGEMFIRTNPACIILGTRFNL